MINHANSDDDDDDDDDERKRWAMRIRMLMTHSLSKKCSLGKRKREAEKQ